MPFITKNISIYRRRVIISTQIKVKIKVWTLQSGKAIGFYMNTGPSSGVKIIWPPFHFKLENTFKDGCIKIDIKYS